MFTFSLHSFHARGGQGFLGAFVVTALLAAPLFAKEPTTTRLVFQDREDQVIKWVDLTEKKGLLTASDAQVLAGFPKLDKEQQSLVQMVETRGYLLAGVRDEEAGALGSGWILVHSGVDYIDHGDHGHWKYPRAPTIRKTVIDQSQGNPAHLYIYNHVFYMANDAKHGFTRLDPATIPMQGDIPSSFHQGGGNHITLAVAKDLGFASWIDRDGENAGRVDIMRIQPAGNKTILRSLYLPSGTIHGATEAANKIFLAPRDGVYWIDANVPPQSFAAHALSLGDPLEEDVPRRTGAFAPFQEHVLCVSGLGESAQLAIIDARPTTPSRQSVALNCPEGVKPATPRCVRTRSGKYYAFVCGHADDEGEHEPHSGDESVTIIDLDPNKDKSFNDARVLQTLPIGASAVDGHAGHHAIAFDADGRRAFIANPGDGTITVIGLKDLAVESTITVGGKPESLIAIGGRGR